MLYYTLTPLFRSTFVLVDHQQENVSVSMDQIRSKITVSQIHQKNKKRPKVVTISEFTGQRETCS